MAVELAWRGFRRRFAEKLDALYEAEGPGFGQVEFAKRVADRSGVSFIQSRVSTLSLNVTTEGLGFVGVEQSFRFGDLPHGSWRLFVRSVDSRRSRVVDRLSLQ